MINDQKTLRKPAWFRRKMDIGVNFQNVRNILRAYKLLTVCEEALCPNRGECFSKGTATFLILGNNCTRACRFCAVSHNATEPPDPAEPLNVAEAVKKLELNYVVITSVTRDDLPDGGASHFAETITQIRRKSPQIIIEVLIPDFHGSEEALGKVVSAHPNVISHNLETVPRLYPLVRPKAQYLRSLKIMRTIKQMDEDMPIKSGIMLGLGETYKEIRNVLSELLEAKCSFLTIGQYLQPTGEHLPVSRYVSPREFTHWQSIAVEMGFKGAAGGPHVRSSYYADELYNHVSKISRQSEKNN